MPEWYLQQASDISGPYSWEELRFLAARRKIAAAAKVRQGSAGVWAPIESVPGLLGAGSAAATATVQSVREAPAAPPDALSTSLPMSAAAPPPPLPDETSKAKPRWLALAALCIAGLLFGILLLLLAVVFASRGAASSGSGTAAHTGGSAEGASSTSTDGTDVSSSQAGANGGSDQEESPADPEPPGIQESAAPAPSQPASEPADDPDSSAGVPQGGDEGDGSGGRRADPVPPLPRSAAVIMPLDDDDSSVGGDVSSVGAGKGGAAEFFQIRGKGRKFVYVIDCSGSMAGAPFMKARAELLRSINALNSGQSFFVIFFDSQEYPQFYPQTGDAMLRANAANKGRARKWVNEFAPLGGGTDPRAALLRALALKPDAIYLFSDGEFYSGIADEVRAQNRRRTPIHTVSFMTRAAEALLQQIAKENHGTYRFVP